MSQFAVMNIEKGEEIISALVSGHIAGTGRYKFLAKKRKDKKIEWAHFVERETKENSRPIPCLPSGRDAVNSFTSKFPMTNWPSEHSFHL